MIRFEPSGLPALPTTPTVPVENRLPCALPLFAVEPLNNPHRGSIRNYPGIVKHKLLNNKSLYSMLAYYPGGPYIVFAHCAFPRVD